MHRAAFFTLLALSLTSSLAAQQTATTVQRDPQAIAILTQCLNAAGGLQALSAIHDVTATGTITFNAVNQSPQGPVTIKLLGLHRFRLDASLPDGVQSWIIGKNGTFQRNSDGSEWSLPVQNLVKAASVTFPLLQVLTAAQDPSFSVVYGGLVSHNGQQAHDVSVQQTFSSKDDPSGGMSNFTKAHIYIDPTTLSVQSIEDNAYRADGDPGETPHEVRFGNYQTLNGILAPTRITEFLAGQKLSTIELTQINLNTGLSESDFQ